MDQILRRKIYDALTARRPEFQDAPELAQRVKDVTEMDIDSIAPVIDAEIERIRETKVNP